MSQKKDNFYPTDISEQVCALGQQKIDFSGVSCLPSDIQKLIADPNTFSHPDVLAYITSHSAIAKILHENPASDRMLRIVYPDFSSKPLTEGLDYFLSQSLSGQALRDRLDVCSKWLVENFVKPGKIIVDLGGGSGSYAFTTLKNIKVPQGFYWKVIDIDAETVYACRQQAAKKGLSGFVFARKTNFLSNNSVMEKFDYAVLIGILCGMTHKMAVDCLRRIKIHLKPGAELLIATLLQQAFDEDPQTFRILCNVGGWQLRPKKPQEVVEICKEAGWAVQEVMSERKKVLGQYILLHTNL